MQTFKNKIKKYENISETRLDLINSVILITWLKKQATITNKLS
jgi:hypothetical protein